MSEAAVGPGTTKPDDEIRREREDEGKYSPARDDDEEEEITW